MFTFWLHNFILSWTSPIYSACPSRMCFANFGLTALQHFPTSIFIRGAMYKKEPSTYYVIQGHTHPQEREQKGLLQVLWILLLILISVWCLPSQGPVNPRSTCSFPLITKLLLESCYLTITLVQDSWRMASKHMLCSTKGELWGFFSNRRSRRELSQTRQIVYLKTIYW